MVISERLMYQESDCCHKLGCVNKKVSSSAAIASVVFYCYTLTVSYFTLAVSDRHVNHRRFHSKCDLYGSSADSVIVR